MDTLRQRCWVDTKFSRPLIVGHRYTTKFIPLAVPSISGLLCAWYPAAVFRTIWSIIVNSVNAQFVCVAMCKRPIPKYCEIIPCGADGYASGTIIPVRWICRTITANPHLLPYPIQACFVAAMLDVTLAPIHRHSSFP